ncbi:MAG: DNA-3-methyladenine glycosylase, partial [Candidatus Omnitrophica bacterium]|nr:DNA-3-methyladenine glycosylase [Candidatus Omnitrophota bacterium]
MQRLNRNFFQRPADTVAKDMLGKYIIRKFAGKKAILRIVETEAYMGVDDQGSHSYEGKITARNKVMYEKGGVFYIYKIYGLYHCLNIVANKKGIPEAVFIRAAEP